MPPQNPTDRDYPEQQRWDGSSEQQRSDGSSEQRRWNDPGGDATQTQSYYPQGSASPPPLATPLSPAAPRPPVSRRSILRGAAGVSVLGAAAAAGAGAVVALNRQDNQATLMPVSKPVATAPMAPTAMAGPLVVYIADTTSGLLDVFGGTGATQVNNPALVRQLLANLKLA